MSILFTPIRLAKAEIKNRFVHSATYEAMAGETGEVTEELISRYRTLGKGEIGLIIPGYMYVHPLGRTKNKQIGIHSDEMIPGLHKLVDTIHQQGGNVAFQLVHVGRQTTKEIIGQTPMAPSSKHRDPLLLVKPRAMTESDIQEVIKAFGKSAKRAVEAGADGVQLHAAHGYLINEFLSPFLNHRKDTWGGSDENRFRFLREIFLEVRKNLPAGMPLLVKLNTNDFISPEGITPVLAKKYAGWLADLGVDGVENSCGIFFSFMSAIRGEVPVAELAMMHASLWKRLLLKILLKSMVGKYDFYEGYNLEDAKVIKPSLGKVPLMAVGGMRSVAHMEEVVAKGDAEFISMCRPFIREPFLVKRIREGKAKFSPCKNCNRCFAAVANDLPVRCYYEH